MGLFSAKIGRSKESVSIRVEDNLVYSTILHPEAPRPVKSSGNHGNSSFCFTAMKRVNSVCETRAFLLHCIPDYFFIACIPAPGVPPGSSVEQNRFALAVTFRSAEISVGLRICRSQHGILMLVKVSDGLLVQQGGGKFAFIA